MMTDAAFPDSTEGMLNSPKYLLEKHKFCKNFKKTMSEISSDDEERDSILSGETYCLYCALCGVKVDSKLLLDAHMVSHGSNKNTCKVCGKFVSKASLKMHMKIHTGEKNFICEFCGINFRRKRDLCSHLDNHLPKVYECEQCGRGYGSASKLAKHKKRTHEGRKHQCEVCGMLFNQSGHLNVHKYRHSKERKFKCEVCGKRFRTKGVLDSHSIIHSNKRQECNICGKTLATYLTLKSHMKIHTGEKPYQCMLCDKAFKTKATLKYHSSVHQEKDDYAKTNRAHQVDNTNEDDQKILICGDLKCSKMKFTSFGDLQLHMEQHGIKIENGNHQRESDILDKPLKSNIRYCCYMCGQLYSSRSAFNTHMQTVHTEERRFKCMLCDKSFKRKSYLNIHLASHRGEKKYSCDICGKCFTQRSSLNTHTNLHNSTYKCADCGKIFGRKILYKKHLTQVHGEAESSPEDRTEADCPDHETEADCRVCDEDSMHNSNEVNNIEEELMMELEKQESIIVEEIDLDIKNEGNMDEDICLFVEIANDS